MVEKRFGGLPLQFGLLSRIGSTSTSPRPSWAWCGMCYVAPTEAQAEAECRAAWAAWFRHINFLWDKAGVVERLNSLEDFEALRGNEVCIVGSPQTVRDQVQRAVDTTGANYFCAIFTFGDLRHEQAMTSMRLFVQEVMPAVR